jgi:hypothetical protein
LRWKGFEGVYKGLAAGYKYKTPVGGNTRVLQFVYMGVVTEYNVFVV